MNTTTELQRCTHCGKERRAETLRVEKQVRPGGACVVRTCPTCQAQRKPPMVMTCPFIAIYPRCLGEGATGAVCRKREQCQRYLGSTRRPAGVCHGAPCRDDRFEAWISVEREKGK